MAYTPPVITPAGLSVPLYSDYEAYLIQQFLIIFGAASYLGPDTADYQDIAVRSLQASQTVQALQAVYLAYNPQFAIGTSLDIIGRLIGTPRKEASYSTAILTLSGTAGTTVANGIVRDTSGNLWNLPALATIGSGGTVTAIATAQQLGNITANIGTITSIATATLGWTSVTNLAAAVPGQAVEQDSAYRARLLVSQAKPSLSLLAGTAAAIAAVPGVARSIVYENPANFTAGYGLVSTSGTSVTLLVGYPFDSTDASQPITINGVVYSISSVSSSTSLTLTTSAGSQTSAAYFIGTGISLGPAHSITCVVESGSSSAIAQAIYNNHGIGCYTNGTTTVTVTDPSNPAITMAISFDILSYLFVYVALNVHPLTGFTTATQVAIQSGVVTYLSSLGIGESVVFSELYGAALTARANPDVPAFSIHSISSGSLGAQTTATLNSTTSIVVASATGIANGQTVVGTGIPANTTVTSIASAPTIVLSAAATVTASGVVVSFFPTGTVDIPMGYNAAAEGSSTFVVVNLV